MQPFIMSWGTEQLQKDVHSESSYNARHTIVVNVQIMWTPEKLV